MRQVVRKRKLQLPPPHLCRQRRRLSRQQNQPCPPRHPHQLLPSPKQKRPYLPQRQRHPQLKRPRLCQAPCPPQPPPPRPRRFRSLLRPQPRPPAVCRAIRWRSSAAATTAVPCWPPANTLPRPTAAIVRKWTLPGGRWGKTCCR